MIHGAPFWNDRGRIFFSQENNPTEQLLKKRKNKGWLESCGPTAAVSCLAALDYDLNVCCPGSYKPQPEEILMDFFNDPRNYAAFEKIRRDTDPISFPGNRIPQWYPHAVKEVFGAVGDFVFTNEIGVTISALKKAHAVMLCLIEPSHFIAAVAYDDETKEIIYNDSWPSRWSDGNGFNRRMNEEDFEKNVKNYVIIYMGRHIKI